MTEALIPREHSKLSGEAKKFLVDLRNFMRDTEKFNRLLKEEEVDESALLLATRMAVDNYATIPPLMGSPTLTSILNSRMLHSMLFLTAGYVLCMNFQQQERNHLKSSSGGRKMEVSEKGSEYKQSADYFLKGAREMIQRYKLAQNVQTFMGTSGIHSEYSYLHNEDYL